jgi:hypothetical protein
VRNSEEKIKKSGFRISDQKIIIDDRNKFLTHFNIRKKE